MKEQSFAMELLQDYKKANKRQFIIIIVILVMWFCTIGYLIYILNDIGTIETTSKQEIKDILKERKNRTQFVLFCLL